MADIAASVLAKLKIKLRLPGLAINNVCSSSSKRSFYASWQHLNMPKTLC